jgi:hypothetical protein
MIVFSSLKEAISYKKECPFCNSLLQFDNRDFSNIYKPYDRNLLFNLLGDDLLVIDLDTEKLDLLLSKNKQDSVNYKYNGLHYQRLILECQMCFAFGYTLQIQIDMSNLKLFNILLNTESLSYEDEKGILYEIKNIYPSSSTSFCYYDEKVKHQRIPLINLDLKNPLETINKIKKLILFS